ncbi:hypothetical protein [Frankia sp. AvcI1]|uniref:hypothetical protein n=1 Tax=Frankia sp. AvcI1 TaxID=573496 RepID=UPI0005A52E28|nr:hypothetical protein [Frankia sp. AvcI1]
MFAGIAEQDADDLIGGPARDPQRLAAGFDRHDEPAPVLRERPVPPTLGPAEEFGRRWPWRWRRCGWSAPTPERDVGAAYRRAYCSTPGISQQPPASPLPDVAGKNATAAAMVIDAMDRGQWVRRRRR